MMLTGIARRPPPLEQAAGLEATQDAAEIARVELQVGGQTARGRPVTHGDLVQHATFRQRVRAAQQPLLQDAEAPRVEPAEAPDGVHRRIPLADLHRLDRTWVLC